MTTSDESDSGEGPLAELARRASRFSLTRGELVDRVGTKLEQRLRGVHGAVACALAFAALSWLPLVLLAASGGVLLRGGIRVSLAWDLAVHVRALIGIPLLVLSERLIDNRMRAAVERFAEERLVPAGQCAQFERALERAEARSRSPTATILLIMLSYAGTFAATRYLHGGAAGTWMAPTGSSISPAGWWYFVVSLPIFQFLFLMALWRWALWAGFLWRASRLRLQLIGTHPDLAGGLGFLDLPIRAFALVIVALSAVASATWTQHLVARTVNIESLAVPLLALVGFAVVVALLPMTFFAPVLRQVQLEFGRRYAIVAEEYSRLFDHAFGVPGRALGEGSIERLPAEPIVNLGTIADIVSRMRIWPVGRRVFVMIVMAVLVPMAPLVFAAASPRTLLQRLIEVVL